MSGALANLEKQAVKQRTRWREKARRSELPTSGAAEPAKVPASRKSARVSAAAGANPSGARVGPRIFRSSHHERRKPITLEEAILQMEDGRDYLVYRDADKQSVSMLVRRRDGHFDLIES
jgi:putative sigma-54 modulation protein